MLHIFFVYFWFEYNSFAQTCASECGSSIFIRAEPNRHLAWTAKTASTAHPYIYLLEVLSAASVYLIYCIRIVSAIQAFHLWINSSFCPLLALGSSYERLGYEQRARLPSPLAQQHRKVKCNSFGNTLISTQHCCLFYVYVCRSVLFRTIHFVYVRAGIGIRGLMLLRVKSK